MFNQSVCGVQAPKTTRPTILLEAQAPVLGCKAMPLEHHLERADQSSGSQCFPSPNYETVQQDMTIHATTNQCNPCLSLLLATKVWQWHQAMLTNTEGGSMACIHLDYLLI